MTTAVPLHSEPEVRLSFSKTLPGWQFAWDSTSLGTFKECPRKYQLSILFGYRHRKATNLHLRFGQLYHRALEVYDHRKCDGLSHEMAMRAALLDLAEGCQDEAREPCVKCNGTGAASYGDLPANRCWDCEGKGSFLITRRWWDPNEGLTPEKVQENTKTIYTLFRTVVWYLDRFEDDPAQTIVLSDGRPAVELSFRFDTGWKGPDGESILMCGHMDRVVTISDEPWVLDRKTTKQTITKNYTDSFHPDNQMSLYTAAGRIAFAVPVKGVIVDAVQIAKGFSRFERFPTLRTEGQINEWLEDTKFWIGLAGHFAEIGYYPMNDKSCDKYGGCPFRGVCQKDPAVREIWMGDYQVSLWDPLKVRGDV